MIDPLDITDPIPEGWTFIAGKGLTNRARPRKIPFRIVNDGRNKGHPVSMGIIIRNEDMPRWKEGERIMSERKVKEAHWASRKQPR